jgi:hypothetical protein
MQLQRCSLLVAVRKALNATACMHIHDTYDVALSYWSVCFVVMVPSDSADCNNSSAIKRTTTAHNAAMCTLTHSKVTDMNVHGFISVDYRVARLPLRVLGLAVSY